MSLAERLMAGVEYDTNGRGCWLWSGAAQPSGYGKLWNGERVEQTHRVSYREFVGAIPADLEIDHECRVRACLNPAHLRPMAHRENLLIGETFAAREAAQTHCIHGHPFAGPNLRIATSGSRQCRACDRIRQAGYRQARRAA